MEWIFEKLATTENLMLVGAIFAVLQVVKMVVPKWASTKLGQRLTPIIPEVLGVGGALMGLGSGNTWQEKIAMGLMAGFAASKGFKVGKTTVLGKGISEIVVVKKEAKPDDSEKDQGA